MGNWGRLPQVKGLGAGAGTGDQSQMPWLLPAARTDPEAALRVAAAGIQAVGAEVVPALIAAQQALAAEALFAVVADGNFTALDQVQLAPVDERRSAG
jgi:hypothetical protein